MRGDCLTAIKALLAFLPAVCFGQQGASQVFTRQSGTGAVLRSAESKLRETVSVTDFGAKGDGSTNDTLSFQSAINSHSGVSVMVPPGTYSVSAMTMGPYVNLICSRGATLTARDNSETMLTVGNGVNGTGISGCTMNANGKTGFQAISIGRFGGSSSTRNTLSNLIINGPSIGILTQESYFNLFENIRVIGSSSEAYEFGTNTTSTTCLNCSAISVGSSLTTGFTIHNGGAITFNGTMEGTLVNSIYQADDVSVKVYFENSGSVNASAWCQVGTQGGTTTSSISFDGSTFGTGAQYALAIEQVQGLSVRGSQISTSIAAFLIDNSGSSNGTKRGLNFSSNAYNIGNAGYDPAKIYAFTNSGAGNDLSYNISSDTPNPIKMTGVKNSGISVLPPDASMNNGEGTFYVDPATGVSSYRFRDSTGTMQQGVSVGGDCFYIDNAPTFGASKQAGSLCFDRTTDANWVGGPVLRGDSGVRLMDRAGNIVAQFGGYMTGGLLYNENIVFPFVPGPYANNAAAVSAGLTVGMLYRSGDNLNIVH